MENKDLLKEKIAESDVVMNNTGVGMGDAIDKTPIDKNTLDQVNCVLMLFIIQARQDFLESEQMGCKIMNGLGMSLYQGSRADRIMEWSNSTN